jgi:hypothetical protein
MLVFKHAERSEESGTEESDPERDTPADDPSPGLPPVI